MTKLVLERFFSGHRRESGPAEPRPERLVEGHPLRLGTIAQAAGLAERFGLGARRHPNGTRRPEYDSDFGAFTACPPPIEIRRRDPTDKGPAVPEDNRP